MRRTRSAPSPNRSGSSGSRTDTPGSRTDGRGSRSDGERTRARLLEVALPLFAARGYAGTSVRAVAGAADVNVATIAYHFGDKHGLYLEVIEALYTALSGLFPQVELGASTDPVRDAVEAAWAFACGHRMHIMLVLRHVLDAGAHAEVVLERWSEPLLARAEQWLAILAPTLPPAHRRGLILSVQHILVRFALEDPAQLRRLLGVTEDADTVVVDVVSDLVRARLLALTPR